nr:PREDICTED: uncharacterized protein LOC109044773 [Bemisia tabaci]
MDLAGFQRHLENLRIIFLLHFILISWALLGYWTPTAYLFYNGAFLFTLLWGLHNKESEEPIIMALYINCLSILFDVPVILFFFPLVRFGSQILSIIASLLNLLLRFFTIISLSKLLQQRNGTIPPFLSSILGAAVDGEERSYEDIDRTTIHQSVPQTEVGLDAKLSCKQQPKIPPKTSQCKSTPQKHSKETSEDEVPNSSKTLSHTPSETSHCKSNHSQCLTKTYEDELVEPSETSSRTSSKASVCEVITPDLYPEEAPEDKNVQSSKTLHCKRTPDHSPDKTCERKC